MSDEKSRRRQKGRRCGCMWRGLFFPTFPHYVWFALTHLTHLSNPPSLSDTVEIIWEERREQQKLSTVIVCINHSACIHSERKKKKSVIRVHSPPSFPFNSEICGDPLPLHTDYRENSSAPCSVHSGYNPKSDLFLLLWLTIILTFESI